MVGFEKEDLMNRLRILTGNLPDELISQALNLNDTPYWKISSIREKIKQVKYQDKVSRYSFRAFDKRFIFYLPDIIERGDARYSLMKHLFAKDNIALTTTRKISQTQSVSVFICSSIGDVHFISDRTYFFPLYLYPDQTEGLLFAKDEVERTSNLTDKFLQAIRESLGSEPTPEEIFYYIYAVLYSPTYRKRYEEFLKIDFPRIPMPADYESFKALSNLGRELIDLHLLKHHALDETWIGFPQSDSNKVEKVYYDENTRRVYLNKEQYFEGISKAVWEYRIGAYQAMEKYLKDRKGRKLSLDEINHYMKVARAIRLTIELQEKIDDIYRKDFTMTL